MMILPFQVTEFGVGEICKKKIKIKNHLFKKLTKDQ